MHERSVATLHCIDYTKITACNNVIIVIHLVLWNSLHTCKLAPAHTHTHTHFE